MEVCKGTSNLAPSRFHVPVLGCSFIFIPLDASQRNAWKKHLEPFPYDLHYFEQPKGGHWWSNTDEPGAACVDWAPMFDLFAHRVIPRKDQVRVRPIDLDDETVGGIDGATYHPETRTLNLVPDRIAGADLPRWVEGRLIEAVG